MTRKLILISLATLFAVLLCSLPAEAQSSCTPGAHCVTVGWTASIDTGNAACPTLCSYQILRAPAACSTNPAVNAFVQVATAPSTATQANDTSPLVGNSCYVLVFTVNGVPSVDSNTAAVSITPATGTGFHVISSQ